MSHLSKKHRSWRDLHVAEESKCQNAYFGVRYVTHCPSLKSEEKVSATNDCQLSTTRRITAQTLRHSDVPPGFEQHHGNRASRKRISNDQLGDDTSKSRDRDMNLNGIGRVIEYTSAQFLGS